MLTFIFIAFAFFLVIYIKLRTDIYNDESSRKAHPTSLYPNVFFNEVFFTCKEEDVNEIERLQKEIAALQLTRTPGDSKNTACSISNSTKIIVQEYEKCLQSYLTDFQNSKDRNIAIERLKNKIELGHKTIEIEKEAFLSDNGENTVSFNFNRQNQFTDILLTGISIPILLETLNWEVNDI